MILLKQVQFPKQDPVLLSHFPSHHTSIGRNAFLLSDLPSRLLSVLPRLTDCRPKSRSSVRIGFYCLFQTETTRPSPKSRTIVQRGCGVLSGDYWLKRARSGCGVLSGVYGVVSDGPGPLRLIGKLEACPGSGNLNVEDVPEKKRQVIFIR